MPQWTAAIFERDRRWEPELQRQFPGDSGGHPIRIRACRRIRDLPELLTENSTRIVLLDIDAAPADCLQYLGRQVGRSDQPPVIVVVSAETAGLEWLLRELGAIAVVPRTTSGEEMAKLCRRLWNLKQRVIEQT